MQVWISHCNRRRGRGTDRFPGIQAPIAVRTRCRAEARRYLVNFDVHTTAEANAIKTFDKESSMDKITPFLWYDGKAEEAANLYVSIFKNSKRVKVRRNGDGGPGPKGSVMGVDFELEGRSFIAFNGGPHFTFNPAISLFVNCDTQQEVDELWDKLVAGGKPVQCGWLTDKFGVSWQIIPKALGEMMNDPDPAKSSRVVQAMMKMIKIDVAGLTKAYNGN
jgi:predicted 3-demethylubiquinone-9 3-methyltransferase (glyoxalase superfamily)